MRGERPLAVTTIFQEQALAANAIAGFREKFNLWAAKIAFGAFHLLKKEKTLAAHATTEDMLPADAFETDLGQNGIGDAGSRIRFWKAKESNPDHEYYLHFDSRPRVTVLVDRMLPAEGRILDLMSSARSVFSKGKRIVKGVGLVPGSLRSNETLTEFKQHDLNSDPRVPYKESFDAVVVSFGIMYWTQPFAVLRDAYTHLKPGGNLIIAFSEIYPGYREAAARLWKKPGVFGFQKREDIVRFYLRSADVKGEIAREEVLGGDYIILSVTKDVAEQTATLEPRTRNAKPGNPVGPAARATSETEPLIWLPKLWIPHHQADEKTRATADELSPGLWLGNAEAARMAAQWGFTAILNLAPQEPATYPPGVVYKKIGITDAIFLPIELLDPLVREAVQWAYDRLQEGHRVLLHCEDGAYRSPMVALALTSVLYPQSPFEEVLWWIWGIRHIRPPPLEILSIIQNLREQTWLSLTSTIDNRKHDPSGPRTRAWFDLRKMLDRSISVWRAMDVELIRRGRQEAGQIKRIEYFPTDPVYIEDLFPKRPSAFSFRDRLEKITDTIYGSFNRSGKSPIRIETMLKATKETVEISLRQVGHWIKGPHFSLEDDWHRFQIHKTPGMTIDFFADHTEAQYVIRFPRRAA